LSGNETLGEEQIVLILRMDVSYSPVIAKYLHCLSQAMDLELTTDRRHSFLRACRKTRLGLLLSG
jgi:hypothetical protein